MAVCYLENDSYCIHIISSIEITKSIALCYEADKPVRVRIEFYINKNKVTQRHSEVQTRQTDISDTYILNSINSTVTRFVSYAFAV